jgi:hypothetical protein
MHRRDRVVDMSRKTMAESRRFNARRSGSAGDCLSQPAIRVPANAMDRTQREAMQ